MGLWSELSGPLKTIPLLKSAVWNGANSESGASTSRRVSSPRPGPRGTGDTVVMFLFILGSRELYYVVSEVSKSLGAQELQAMLAFDRILHECSL